MKHRIVLLLALFFAVTTFKLAVADVPSTMNYQGRLTKQDGAALTDGNYDITFYLYDAATAGTYLWSESHQVSTKSGYFNVVLGSKTTLAGVDINTYHYLAIKVGTDSEMTPRQPLASVPYAMRAQTAVSAESTTIAAQAVHATAADTATNADEATHAATATSADNGVPVGAILMMTGTSCPTGYTRFTGLDGRFPRGAATSGGTGGSDNHTHTGTTNSGGQP